MPEPGTMCPGVGKLTGYARILFDKQNDLPASGMDHSDLAHGMRQAAILFGQKTAENCQLWRHTFVARRMTIVAHKRVTNVARAKSDGNPAFCDSRLCNCRSTSKSRGGRSLTGGAAWCKEVLLSEGSTDRLPWRGGWVIFRSEYRSMCKAPWRRSANPIR